MTGNLHKHQHPCHVRTIALLVSINSLIITLFSDTRILSRPHSMTSCFPNTYKRTAIHLDY